MNEDCERAAVLLERHTRALHSAIERMKERLARADGPQQRYIAIQKAESEIGFAWSRAQKAVARLDEHPKALDLRFKLEDAELHCRQEMEAARNEHLQ